MKQLKFEADGKYAWREAPSPTITSAVQATVRPLAVACCDLDVAVVEGHLPMPPGHAVGHEGVAEIVAVGDDVVNLTVGDRVIVPFQINCGQCRACIRGATGSCAALPLMAMYGMAPLAGLDGGGFLSDLILVPYADAMLVAMPESVDASTIASMSDNIPDAWRTVGPYREELDALEPIDRRVLVVGRMSVGLYAAAASVALGAHVDYVDTDPHRLAIAEQLGAAVHDAVGPKRTWDPYPVTVHTTFEPAVLAATLSKTWPDGVCTDTGVYVQDSVSMPLLQMYTRGVRFVTGRVNARAALPETLRLFANYDLSPVVDQIVPWHEAPAAWPAMTGKTVFTRS